MGSKNQKKPGAVKALNKAKEAHGSLQDALKDARYKEKIYAERRARAEAQHQARERDAERAQREALESQPREEARKKKAEITLNEFRRASKELYESGVQGYDRFDTSATKIMQWSVLGAKTISEKYQPWTRIGQFALAVGKGAVNVAGMIGEKLGDSIEDLMRFRREKGEVDTDIGNINISDMVEVDHEGRLVFPVKFKDIPGNDHIPDEIANYQDELLQNSIAVLLEHEGYKLDADTGIYTYSEESPDREGVMGQPLEEAEFQKILGAQPPEKISAIYREAHRRVEANLPPILDPDTPEHDNSHEHTGGGLRP
ncbi:MAG: cell envelope integrity protein TolA [Legionellaceae bacterium]|nr:cell envelope integrity protein TolA [Legionellaceae bacterium]